MAKRVAGMHERRITEIASGVDHELQLWVQKLLEKEATRHKAEGRWPFRGGWFTEEEIRRSLRQTWRRWLIARVESLLLAVCLLLLCSSLGALLVYVVSQ